MRRARSQAVGADDAFHPGDRFRMQTVTAVLRVLSCWLILSSTVPAGTALADGSGASSRVPYEPGRLVVKYRSDKALSMAQLRERRLSVAPYTGSTNLDHLHQRYRVERIDAAFPARAASVGNQSAASAWSEHTRALGQRFRVRTRRARAGTRMPELANVFVLTVPSDTDILQLAAEYAADPSVEYAEPSYLYQPFFVPNDPFFLSMGSWGQGYADLWGLHSIDAESAWDVSTGAGVTVAVLDTGLVFHVDVHDNLWTNPGEVAGNGIDDDGNGVVDDVHGRWFIGSEGYDLNVHGTHVSGIIAATGNNGAGVLGVAWQAKLMTLAIFGGLGATSQVVAEALVYATDNGADVANMSFGGLGESRLISDAVDYAAANGVVLVAAAGNDAIDVKSTSPANLDPVIGVAAIDHLDQPASFSNYGGKIELAAPGGGDKRPPRYRPDYSILSLSAQNFDPQLIVPGPFGTLTAHFLRLGGTSMAAPHVSGVAALILSRHPEFTVEQVRQALRAGADDLGRPGRDARTGYGRLNAARAVGFESIAVARLHAPRHLTRVYGELIDVIGTAQNPGGAVPQWRLLLRPQAAVVQQIASGTGPITNAILGTIDTGALGVGNHTVQLEVSAGGSPMAIDELTVTRLEHSTYFRQLSDLVPPWGASTTLGLRSNAWSDSGTLVVVEQATPPLQRIRLRDFVHEPQTVAEFEYSTGFPEAVEAVISGDGTTVVFGGPDGLGTPLTNPADFQLYRFDVATGALQQLSNASGGTVIDFRNLSVTADGQRVAFTSRLALDPSVDNPDGNPELFYWDDSDNGFHQVTQTALVQNSAPVIGRNGGLIAFLSAASLDPSRTTNGFVQVFVYDVATHQFRQLTELNGTLRRFASQLALRPDGSRIAAVLDRVSQPVTGLFDRRTVALIDVDAASLTEVLDLPLASSLANPIAFSADGGRVVCVTDVASEMLAPFRTTEFPAPELFQFDIGTGQLTLLTAVGGLRAPGLAVGADGRVALSADLTIFTDVDPEGANDDRSAELYLLDPVRGGGLLTLARATLAQSATGKSSFRLKGELVHVSGPMLDPVSDGISVTLHGANGELFRQNIPGPSILPTSKGWSFSSREPGLSKVTISTKNLTRYKFSLSGTHVGLTAAATPYLALTIQVGSATFGNAQLFRTRGKRLQYP